MNRWLYGLFCLCLLIWPAQAQDAPPSAELIDENGYDITNILLIGTAVGGASTNNGLTDTLMILSINHDTEDVALVSIPRDLHVYAPGLGRMKVNQAYYLGEYRDPERTGFEVLRETITYNLGLTIDHHVLINFDGFRDLIDALGGILLTVDCVIQDWILSDPELDPQLEENYELHTLHTGLHWLDGHQALWYVRSRRTSSDLDRNRRQQDMLRAIWHRLQDGGLLDNAPQLWETFTNYVVTDLTLGDVMGLLPLALSLDTADVHYYTFRLRHEVENAYADYAPYRYVLEPNREAVASLMQQVLAPPTRNQVNGHLPTIAVINASGIDGLGYVAADRLELEGFRTSVIYEWSPPRDYSQIVDHTGLTKGSHVGTLQQVLRVTDQGVRIDPDPARDYDYRVFIGNSYQFNACTRPVIQPDLSAANAQ